MRSRTRLALLGLFTCFMALSLILPMSAHAVVSLSGTVTETDGTPIQGACVEVYDSFSGDFAAGNYADLGGQYSLNDLAPGAYDFWVTADGFSAGAAWSVLYDGATTVVQDFSLNPIPLAVSGYMSDELGNAMVGVLVELNNFDYYTSCVTNGSGYYELYAPAGEYELGIWNMPGYLTHTAQITFDGANAVNGDVQLVPMPVLEVDAFEPDDSSIAASAIAVNGASQLRTFYPAGDEDWVSFSAVAGQTYKITTSQANTTPDTVLYLFDGVGAQLGYNDDNVGLYSEIFWTAESDMTAFIKVCEYNGDAGDYNLMVEEIVPAFSGRVVDSDGVAIADAEVAIYNEELDNTAFVYTDANGYYAYDGVPGPYAISASAPGFFVSDYVYAVYNGSLPVVADFTLAPETVAFSGTVTDGAFPVAMAEVVAYDPDTDFSASAYTDEFGNYDISAPEGTYDLEVSAPGYAAEYRDALYFDGVTASVQNFQLNEVALAFSGYVTDPDGVGIEGAQVEFWDGASGYGDFVWTDMDGFYEIYAPAGTYDLTVQAEGYFDGLADFLAFDGVNAIPQDFSMEPLPPLDVDAFEPDDAKEAASPITTDGAPQEHTLFPATDYDWMSFQAVAGQAYLIETSGYDDTDTYLYLYDLAGNELGSDDDGGEDYFSRIVWTAPEDMSVLLKVREYDATETGAYAIKVEPATVSLGGTVTDADGNSIQDGEMWLVDPMTGQDWSAYLDTDGTYSFFNLPAGDYELNIGIDGYLPVSATVSYDGATPVVRDFALEPLPLALTGMVTDTDGAPLRDIEVSVYDPVADVGYVAWTDVTGRYELFAPAGTYEMYAYSEFYEPQYISELTFDGATALTQDFTLAAYPVAFNGVVRDLSATPIADASVWAQDVSTGMSYSAYADEAGNYQLFAPAGTYDLYTWAEGYFEAEQLGITFDGTSAFPLDWALGQLPVAASGYVKDDAGNPVEGAEIALWDLYWEESFYGTSDVNGYYEVRAPANTYQYEVWAQGYEGATDTLGVFDGTNAIAHDFALQQYPIGFTGTVTGAGSAPLAGVEVSAFDEVQERYYWTKTGADGKYTLRLPAGTYDVGAWKDGHESVYVSGVAFDGTTAVVKNFQLTQWAIAVAGQVTGLNGEPVKGAELGISSIDLGYEMGTSTDENGYYEFRLPAGTYDMWLSAELYVGQDANDLVFSGTKLVKNFSLVALPGSASGVVSDANGPVAGAEVWVDGVGPVDTTDANGVYTLAGLAAGEHVLDFKHDDYALSTRLVDISPAANTLVSPTLVPRGATGRVSGAVDDGTNPLGGVKIYNGATLVGVTAADGTYSLALIPGDYTLTFKKYGFADLDELVSIIIAGDGQLNTSMVATLGSISGTVTDGTAPLKDVEVWVGGVKKAMTDVAGGYSIAGLSPGTQNLRFKKAGYNEKTTDVQVTAGAAATCNVTMTLVPVIPPDATNSVYKIAGTTRFSGSVAIAAASFDPDGNRSWPGVTDIVLACGDDRASADPLSAAGLSWAYDAPLFLTSSGSTDLAVKQAIKEIADKNGKVKVHIVGGTISVPDARYNEIASYVGAAKLEKHRVLSGGSRYDMAAAIAQIVSNEWEARGNDCPPVVLVANGADPTKFFDALALSPISAAKGYPILLVDGSNTVPAATQAKINDIKADGGATKVVIGGGAKTVTDTVKVKLGGERWAGTTRYSTALVVADKAVANGWLSYEPTGIAAKLPDALTGGSVMGLQGGILVLTDGVALTPETGNWFAAHKSAISTVQCFGGDKSLTPTVRGAIYNRIK